MFALVFHALIGMVLLCLQSRRHTLIAIPTKIVLLGQPKQYLKPRQTYTQRYKDNLTDGQIEQDRMKKERKILTEKERYIARYID